MPVAEEVDDGELENPPANRMVIAALALAGIFVSAYLLLHKIGLIGTLTCGVGDCGTVQASRFAVFLGMPVPLLGILGYAALLGIALRGVQPGRLHDRQTAAALLILGAGAFAFSMYLTALEAFVIRAWCQWCVISAILATLIFLLALVEVPRLRREGIR